MSDSKTQAAPSLPAAPAVKGAALVGGGRINAIVPQDFESAWRMAQIVHKAGMAPKSLDSVEKACVAIMHGLEVGLTPMAALQSIAVINNMPSIYGDGLLGLCQASGLLEDFEETVEYEDDGTPYLASCRVKRVGMKVHEQIVTRAQAQKAGWWSKQGPWSATPHRMLQMRARGWALRDRFADVLRGLHSAEEMSDLPMADITTRGSATTVPAEPRRADFIPPDYMADAAEGWPLHDETGETIGTYPAEIWLDRLSHNLPTDPVDRRKAFLDNNRETAGLITADDDTTVRVSRAIRKLFDDGVVQVEAKSPASGGDDGKKVAVITEPATSSGDQPRAAAAMINDADWKIDESLMGLERKVEDFAKKVEAASTPAEVDAVERVNGDFLEKLGSAYRKRANDTLKRRREALGK